MWAPVTLSPSPDDRGLPTCQKTEIHFQKSAATDLPEDYPVTPIFAMRTATPGGVADGIEFVGLTKNSHAPHLIRTGNRHI
jgi:hypothetical protein